MPDRMSQPSRAVIFFCKVNGIEYEEIKVHIPKAINLMQKLPAIADGRFKLFESHAIHIYLAYAFPGVATIGRVVPEAIR
ncbi:hypothetical protein E1A91_A12G244800v1 [Gossypium mustelinum]|uniref:GST N-terminal domain-containing protein n=1 Tax=Gossypium mustelinum TaxID=34275 RepID=A0A5D2X0K1_GOSMU|nr:glutathione S-transferase T1-like [Gossypium arboreum]TYJ06601.1 hypothetical protein E1A91_A12G244800v1 [Gossypium mustelinum]